MKTYEWVIKVLSFILCGAAVCAGFAIRENEAKTALNNYIISEDEKKTERLCQTLTRLKNSLSRCVSDEASPDDLIETGYCCKAASDAVCAVDGGKDSEKLRAFFERVKKLCETLYKNNTEAAPLQRQLLSELYMRLSALEDVLLSGKASAAGLISALSSGLTAEDQTKKIKKLDRISMNRAEKRAYEQIGGGVRLKNCGIFDDNFVFSSESSCIVLTKKGETYIKSRITTNGAVRNDEAAAKKIAKDHISAITGQPCEVKLCGNVFGIFYFTVYCDGKEYPVGVDKTDGRIVFEVISQ